MLTTPGVGNELCLLLRRMTAQSSGDDSFLFVLPILNCTGCLNCSHHPFMVFLQVPPLLRVLSIPLHCLIHIRKSPLLHRLSHSTRTVCASPTISPPLTISTLASAHSYLWVGFTYIETMWSPYIPCAVNFNYSRATPAHMLYVVSATASHAGKS